MLRARACLLQAVAVQAAQEAALEAAREVTKATAQAQHEMMTLFAQQQREMLSAVTSATGALESRLAKIEDAGTNKAAARAVDVSDGAGKAVHLTITRTNHQG